MRRDMALWWPWYERGVNNVRHVEPRIDPAALTIELHKAMKQPDSFAPAWRAAIDHPMRVRLALTPQPCLLMSAPGDVFAHCLTEARLARPDATLVATDDTAESRAAAMRTFMGPLSRSSD